MFDTKSAATLFYLALQLLGPTAGFSDSRGALLYAVQSMSDADPVQLNLRLAAINGAFDAVGIK